MQYWRPEPCFHRLFYPLFPQYASRAAGEGGIQQAQQLAEPAGWVSTLPPFSAACRMGSLLVSRLGDAQL